MSSDPIKWQAKLVTVLPPGAPPPPPGMLELLEPIDLLTPQDVVGFISMGLQVSGFGPEGLVAQYEQSIKEMEAAGENDRVDEYALDLREKFNLIPMPGSGFAEMIEEHPGMVVMVTVTPVYFAEEDGESMIEAIEDFLKGDLWKDV